MTYFPPIFWLFLASLVPGASPNSHRVCDGVQYDAFTLSAPSFYAVEREYPELPDSLVFEESKEFETQDEKELPTGVSRFVPRFWNESLPPALQSYYLGQALTVFTATTSPSDRLRC